MRSRPDADVPADDDVAAAGALAEVAASALLVLCELSPLGLVLICSYLFFCVCVCASVSFSYYKASVKICLGQQAKAEML